MGTGDPGSVVRLARDTRPPAPWFPKFTIPSWSAGSARSTWRADLPPGTSISFETRTGNVGEPDETWSAWSASQTDPAERHDRVAAGSVHPVPGQAHHDRPAATRPSCARFRLSYRTSNLSPEITPARCSRPEHGRRRRPPDAVEPAVGCDRPQRRRPDFHAQGSQGRLARVDRALRRSRSPRKPSPGIRPRFPRGRIGSSSLASDRPSNSPDEP